MDRERRRLRLSGYPASALRPGDRYSGRPGACRGYAGARCGALCPGLPGCRALLAALLAPDSAPRRGKLGCLCGLPTEPAGPLTGLAPAPAGRPVVRAVALAGLLVAAAAAVGTVAVACREG